MPIQEATSEICKSTATELAQRIRAKELSSVEVVEAHIARIEEVNDEINALVVPQFDEAREAAKKADAVLASGDQVGPLHGVPISIKEFFDVRGLRTTAGIESGAYVADQDAPVVARLREAGAIILGKTNVPQFGIAIESENPIYGRTNNPLDLERSSGGSSGGEAALIAAHGSPLGLGSDGGGSIRLPSHFSGLCGIKPTTNRLSMRGHWQFPAFPAGWSQPGPIARSVDDLELALQILTPVQGETADPMVPPVPLRPSSEVDVSQLRIGFYDNDTLFRPSPAIRRAVQESVDSLQDAGATLVPFECPRPLDVWEIQAGQFAADGGRWMRERLGNSAVDSRIRKTMMLTKVPTFVRKVLPPVLSAMGETTIRDILSRSGSRQLSAYGFQTQLEKQKQFRARFFDRLNQEQVDAIICPPFPSVAMKHNSGDIVFGIAYTQTYNLLGMPAGVVPVTAVQPSEESDREKSKDSVVKQLLRADAGSAGLPVGVQVVARPWREDVALAIMRHLA